MLYLVIERRGDQSEALGHTYGSVQEAIEDIARRIGIGPERLKHDRVRIEADPRIDGMIPDVRAHFVRRTVMPSGRGVAPEEFYVIEPQWAGWALASLYRRQRKAKVAILD